MSDARERGRKKSRPTVRAHVQPTWCIEDYVYPAGVAEVTEVHAHATWQLCLSYHQPGRYRWGGRTLDVPRSSLSLMPPGLAHRAEDTEERSQPARFTVLYVRAPRWRFRRDRPTVWEGRSIVKEAEALLDWTKEQGGEGVALAWANALDRWGLAADGESELDRAPAALEHMRARIDADPAGDHRLEVMAAWLGTSPAQVCRLFRRAFGLPPHAYVVEARLRLAKQLLVQRESAAGAAAAAGFSDQSHLHRLLRRHSDVTVASYG